MTSALVRCRLECPVLILDSLTILAVLIDPEVVGADPRQKVSVARVAFGVVEN